MLAFPFLMQEQLITFSFCKIHGWSILNQSFANFIMGDTFVDAKTVLDPRHFFCQALFDNLWRFMCFLGTFLGKSRDLRVYFGKMLRFTSFLGTFLGKMRFFRHILYAHFQAIFLGSQAPKTFMQAWSQSLPE